MILFSLLVAIISACGGGSSLVDQLGFSSATLSWMPPTQNADETPLTDLAGYKIYYGTEPGNYQRTIHIDNPGLSMYVVQSLAPNTYCFVLTAINSRGVESRFSNEVCKLVL
jgi:hypothetical protein